MLMSSQKSQLTQSVQDLNAKSSLADTKQRLLDSRDWPLRLWPHRPGVQQLLQVVQEALQDSVLDAGAADDQNAVASAAADADLHLQQAGQTSLARLTLSCTYMHVRHKPVALEAQADRLATELSDGTDRFRMAQALPKKALSEAPAVV